MKYNCLKLFNFQKFLNLSQPHIVVKRLHVYVVGMWRIWNNKIKKFDDGEPSKDNTIM